jgi:hypothetical protein
MGPRRSRFWCPSWRLGVFVVASAVTLNFFLQWLRPDVASADATGAEDRSIERRKRRLERHRKTIESFLNGPWSGARAQDPVAVVLSADVADELVPAPELEALPTQLRVVDFPRVWPTLAQQMRTWDVSNHGLEAILALPDRLVTAAARLLSQARSGDGGVIDTLLDVGYERREGSLISDFLAQLGQREQRYFASYEESSLADTQEVDDFIDDQRKVLWDALRRTYAARYRIRADETMREAAYDPATWRGIDFVLVPPLVVGYAMYRGLDKRFSIGGTRLRIAIEPLADWRHDELPAGLALEWAPAGWPIGLIASAGLEGGEFRMDFIGIGTNVEMVRRALTLQKPGEDVRPR